MSPNRIVALLTPLCALAAGWAASWIAHNIPDANISKESLQAVFIGGMAVVIAPAAQWLHGWQKHEERQAETERLALVADTAAAALAPEAAGEDLGDDLGLDLTDDGGADLDDFDDFEDDLGIDEPEPAAATP